MSTVRLLTTNTLAQTAAKIASVVVTLLIGRLIANPDQGLGLAGFSDYGIIIAFASYFYIISDFGFNAIATKDITEDNSKTESYINNLLGLRIVLSVILIMAGLAILAFTNYSTAIKIGIMLSLVTICSQAIITNGNILFQARLQYWQSTTAIVGGSLISLALASLTFFSGGGLYLYILAVVLGSLTMAAISLLLVRNQIKLVPKFDKQLWRYLIIAALPLGLAVILNLIYIRAGFFILSNIDTQAHGLLSAAYRIFDVALVIPVFMVNALYPILVTRLQSSLTDFKALWLKSFMAMLGVSILVSLAMWIAAPLAIHLTTNESQFDTSISILRGLALIVPIFFITNLMLWATIAMGKRKVVVFFYGIGALISLALNLWLVPQHGYWAIIFVTGATEALIGILLAAQLFTIWNKPQSKHPDNRDVVTASQLTEEELAV